MSRYPGWKRVLRVPRPAGRQAREDVEAEIAFHLETRTDDLVAAGMSPRDARRRAEREFGDVAAAHGGLEGPARRRERRRRLSETLRQTAGDVRYGLRGLRSRPGFAAVAILTLGLAIAANASIFSVVNAVLLRPLPFDDPDALALLWTGSPGSGERGRADYVTADAWRRSSSAFADMAFLDPVAVTLTGDEAAERIGVARVTPNFFSLLGLQPVRGRVFTETEARERARIVVLSHGFWQTRFGGAEDAIGATIRLDGLPSRVIGVLPDGFRIPGLNGDVWEPYTLFPDWEETENEGNWYVIGRLAPEATIEGARVEMTAIATGLDADRPDAERTGGVTVVPLERHVVGPTRRVALWVLIGAALCVLLIASANVTSLSLARGVGRAREFAVRASLGASPGRLVRQILVESTTLAVVAGAIGAALAVAGVGLIRSFGPGDLARLDEASLDPAVLAWTLVVSIGAGILIGLAPAWTATRRRGWLAGGDAGRGGSAGRATRGIRSGLVVGEFALAIVLLTGAGLLVRSWIALSSVDPGFTAEGLVSMNLSTTAYGSDARRVDFYRQVLDRVAALPGVESAGTIGDLFTTGDVERVFTTDGTPGQNGRRVTLRVDEVSEALFATLGTPLVAGRVFDRSDGPDAPPVAVLNETMAARLFTGVDPVGHRFKPGGPESEAPWIAVVGVVGDMRRQGVDVEPIPQLFVPLAQEPSGLETLVVRTAAEEPLEAAAEIREAVRAVDPGVPVYFVSTVEDRLSSDLVERRFQTSLLIGFSLIALAMAAIGIFGLIHYAVAARRREFAIRLAVGAGASDIVGITMTEGARLVGAGLAIGLGVALVAGRASASLLFGVRPFDPVTLVAVTGLLVVVAGAACWIPARRSLATDPVEALRPD